MVTGIIITDNTVAYATIFRKNVSTRYKELPLDAELKKKIAVLARKSRETSLNPAVRAYKAIFTTFDIIDNYVRLSLQDEEISRAGNSILHILISNGGSMTATEISKLVWRSKYATVRVIDTLERDGYVTRTPPENTGDRRKKIVAITAKGVALFEKTFKITMEYLCPRILETLSSQQLAECHHLLEQIGNHTYELTKPFENSHIYRQP
jgi:DNA-binding MarR family transcriptional regulator